MGRVGGKKSSKWWYFLAGLLCGAVAVSAGGLLIYQKITGTNVTGKVHFILDRGKEHIASLGRKGIKKIPVLSKAERQTPVSKDIHLTIDADQTVRRINPHIYGSNLSSKAEFEMNIAKLAADFGITNFRFPGGNSLGYRWQTSSYDFKDRFDKAPLSNIDNVIKFCDIAGAEIVVQVNVESGTAQEAADWVRYMNIERNRRVEYWELGNEVYGDWDKGFMSGDDYVKVIKEYAKLMKAVDPTIKVGADWGGIKYQDFDEAVAKGAFDIIDFVSYHWYPNHINNYHRYEDRNHPFPKELMANSLAVGKLVDRFNRMVERYAPHRKDKIEFAIMEWDGSWDGVPSDLTFQHKGRMWSLSNAIFYANTLAEFAKHGVSIANQFTYQEVMFGIIRGWDVDAGWGGSHWDGKTIRPKGLAFKLMARHFGDIMVESSLAGSPTYHKKADWRPDSFSGDVPYVEGFASRSSKDGSLSILLTNKHAETDFKVSITIRGNGVRPDSQSTVWILNGPDLKAQNDGSPGTVSTKKYELSGVQNKFNYTVPAHSVNLLKIPMKADIGS